jgi:regulation of enolase protein 1 (concanavalin A-like superfamily)
MAMVNLAFSEWKKDVLESATDRFERRLTEETGMLRIQMARMESRLIRWMFVFWLGQLGITLGVVATILRAVELL